jgi:hypothetical protein
MQELLSGARRFAPLNMPDVAAALLWIVGNMDITTRFREASGLPVNRPATMECQGEKPDFVGTNP